MPGNETEHETARDSLQRFLCEQAHNLQRIICLYIVRAGLAQGEVAQALADEVLSETTIEALRHADRFDPATQPLAWLRVIAINVIKRKKVQLAKQWHHEALISDLTGNLRASTISSCDFFDQFINLATKGPEVEIEENERVNEILALVQPGDQEILRLALLHDLDAHALSQVLQISPGTARVRLHRALNRLRIVWGQEQNREQKRGKNHV